MKITAKPLNRLVLATLAGVGLFSLLLPQSSWADDAPRQVNPLEDFNSDQNSSNPFSRTADSFSMLDLIRRATSNTRSWDDYSSDQNENLDSAAAEFRARQRQLIQGQQQPSPSSSVSKPQ